jgi:pilus assembly protein CpaC
MKIDRFVKAALLGLTFGMATPMGASAETLRVMSGTPSGALKVSMNRAVVVESDVPFAELSIANPGIADISTLSDRTIYVLGKTPGRTTLTLLSGDGKLISNVEVHVAPDIAEFKERLRQILPSERIEVRTANDGIVLSGMISSQQNLDRALSLGERYAPERVSNLMSVGGTQQVNLKVRFAEMSRSVRKSLSGSLSFGGAIGGVSTTGASGRLQSSGSGSTSDAVAATGSQGAMQLGFGVGGLRLNILMEALESKGVVRTLAEPNLTALSGKEASFLAGGEYPIPVSSNDNQITVTYKPFGVGLKFTPTVQQGGVINLALEAEVSGVDETVNFGNTDGISINSFKTRKTQTTVELRDGESFAIAGLVEDEFRDNVGAVPWLGDLPVLGALFRSSEYLSAQSELVIIVTAHLVTPKKGDTIALPTDRIRPPSEKGLFLHGKTTSQNSPKSGAANEVAQQDFSGSYGYVME